MNLHQAVSACPRLAGGLEPSLQALVRGHRVLVTIGDPRRLQSSLNLDATLTVSDPQMTQWDYAIGWQSATRKDSCCFAEVHPANTTSATDLICKKKDVEAWLCRNAAAVTQLARETAIRTKAPVWHWLATGAAIAIRKGSQAARRLAAAGISGPKRRLELD